MGQRVVRDPTAAGPEHLLARRLEERTLGGMSGGAVIDVNGHVVGITSRGLTHHDQKGPSLAAWWLPALVWAPTLSWPTGIHDGPSTLSENVTVRVVGREYIEISEDGQFNLTRWT